MLRILHVEHISASFVVSTQIVVVSCQHCVVVHVRQIIELRYPVPEVRHVDRGSTGRTMERLRTVGV